MGKFTQNSSGKFGLFSFYLPKATDPRQVKWPLLMAILVTMRDVTQILSALEQGDPHAAEQLLPLVYDELRRLAAQKLSQEAPGQTLEATALRRDAAADQGGGAAETEHAAERTE